MPTGPRPGSDTRQIVKGVLLGFDSASRTARVSVNDGEGTSLPVLLDIDWTAMVGGLVWVLRDVYNGRSVLVLGACDSLPVDPQTDYAAPSSLLPHTQSTTSSCSCGQRPTHPG